jgi:hypothetical protein
MHSDIHVERLHDPRIEGSAMFTKQYMPWCLFIVISVARMEVEDWRTHLMSRDRYHASMKSSGVLLIKQAACYHEDALGTGIILHQRENTATSIFTPRTEVKARERRIGTEVFYNDGELVGTLRVSKVLRCWEAALK